MEEVVSWHDKIARLPEMDDGWTYQIEFGIDPPCLYQVRPFKPKEKANFKVKPQKSTNDAFILGITPKKGFNFRVEKKLWERYCEDEEINSDNQPSVLIGDMRSARSSDYLPNHQANIWNHSFGLLAHEDIRAMRQAKVSIIHGHIAPYTYEFQQGDWINIRSDGINAKVRKINAQK